MSTLSACVTLCQNRASDPTRDDCEPPCGYWELNSKTSGKQSVLSTLSHLSSPLHICFMFWPFSSYFKLCHYYICPKDLWSVISGVTTLTVFECHEPYPYKTMNLINKCCVCIDCSVDCHSLFLHLLMCPYSLIYKNIESRPTSNSRGF